MAADAPSAYAPGTVSNEIAPPRPAGHPWMTEAVKAAGFGYAFALMVPVLLIPFLAWLSDAVPPLGTRREGYLLAAVLLAALTTAADRRSSGCIAGVLRRRAGRPVARTVGDLAARRIYC